MIDCPSCQKPVEITDKHYGTLFTCPHCNAVYFIDWNGQPEMAQHEAEPQAEAEAPSPVEENSSFDQNFSSGQNDSAEYQNFETPQQESYGYQQEPDGAPATEYYQNNEGFQSGEAYQDNSIPQVDNQDFGGAAQEYAPQESYGTMEEPVAQDAYSSTEPTETESTPYDFSQPLSHGQESPASTPDTADFGDVTSFANADTTAGPLVYTVFIEGIESSQILNQLRDAMMDSRFGWDANTLLNQVGGGRLTLSGLSPAKASVLINRIKYMPLKISWRQDVFAGS